MTTQTAGPPPLAMGYSSRTDRDGPTMTDDPRDHARAAAANIIAANWDDLAHSPAGHWVDDWGTRVVYVAVSRMEMRASNRAIMLTERAGVDLPTLELMCGYATALYQPYREVAAYHRARARTLLGL